MSDGKRESAARAADQGETAETAEEEGGPGPETSGAEASGKGATRTDATGPGTTGPEATGSPEAEPGEGGAEGSEGGAGDSGGGAAGGAEPAGKPEPARKPAPARRGRIAAAVGILGELLITAGLVLALFVVYSLWWTNVLADRQAEKRGDRVREHWAADRGPGDLDTRDGIGFLHVPSMSSDDILVMKGTDPKELNQGIAGYYTEPVKSALPQDQSGNFSLAAHRDGHGAKFHRIDKIDKGDPIVFETKNTWYVYKVFKTLPQTSKYNVDVLDPVPKGSGATKRGRYITLTTCTPVYTSKYRYIVWGELVRTEDVDEDRTPPAELR